MEPSLSKKLFPVPFHQNKFLTFLSNFSTYHPNNILLVNIGKNHQDRNSNSENGFNCNIQSRDEIGNKSHSQRAVQASLDTHTNSTRLSINSNISKRINRYHMTQTIHTSSSKIPHFVPVLTPLSLFERTLCTRQLNQSCR